MKVVITSKNPIKINSTKEAFKKAFAQEYKIIPLATESNVSDQPFSSNESLLGAKNRVNNAMKEIVLWKRNTEVKAGCGPKSEPII